MPAEDERQQLRTKSGVFRSGMNVAKSLAVERNGGIRGHLFGGQETKDEKYAFLFEDEDVTASSRRESKRHATQNETEPDSYRGLN